MTFLQQQQRGEVNEEDMPKGGLDKRKQEDESSEWEGTNAFLFVSLCNF